MTRDREEAKRIYEAAVAHDPSDSWAHHHLGLLLEEEFRDFDGAIVCYQRAVEANPENFCAWNSLGLRMKSKSVDEAIACFRKSLEHEPTYSRAWKNLGLVYQHELKDFQQAQECFERAIEVDPQNSSVYIILGLMLELRGNTKYAEKCYRSAMLADESSPMGYFRLGCLAQTKMKDFKLAKLCYEETLKREPSDFKTMVKLAKLAEERFKDFAYAKDLLTTVIFHNPSDSTSRKRLQWLLKEHYPEEYSRQSTETLTSNDSSSDLGASSPGMLDSSSVLSFENPFAMDLTEEEETRIQCPQGHNMLRVKVKPATYSARATWACEECKKSIGGADLKLNGALYCKVCKYDLCNGCSKKERRSSHLVPRKPEYLGSGAYGQVYKEFDEVTSSYVAVKHLPGGGGGSGTSSTENEVRMMKKFDDNPNIVRVLRYERRPHEQLVYMELCAGSIQGSIEKRGALHESEAKKMVADALRGLGALHAVEPPVIHRDIKPDNLLVGVMGHVKLSDFGLSKHMAVKTAMNTVNTKGTPQFIAPEGFGRIPKWSPKSDIWAIACSWISMVTGRPPYDGKIEACAALETMGWNFIQDPALRPNIPEFLSNDAKRLLARCLDQQPGKRPSSRELLDDPYFRRQDAAPFAGMEPMDIFTRRAEELVEDRRMAREVSSVDFGSTGQESSSGLFFQGMGTAELTPAPTTQPSTQGDSGTSRILVQARDSREAEQTSKQEASENTVAMNPARRWALVAGLAFLAVLMLSLV